MAFDQGKPVGKPATVISGFFSADEKKLFRRPGRVDAGSGRRAFLIADGRGKHRVARHGRLSLSNHRT